MSGSEPHVNDVSHEVRSRVERALVDLPSSSGGIAIVLATASSPPAMALLSSGDVHISGDTVRVGIYGSSSAVERLGGAFSLLVPLGDSAARIEVGSAKATKAAPLAMIEGVIESIRPTAEPPWLLEMDFVPEPSDHSSIPGFLEYWHQVKSWLRGDQPDPPELPG